MSHSVTISVLMPVYNAERYLREAVESVLGQTFGDFELIAVDDGSTDGSLAILRDYERRDPRVRIISRPNTGYVVALNEMLALARGEFIARMDSDDVCLPERFEKQVQLLRESPKVVCVGTRVRFVDPLGRPILDPEVLTDHDRIEAALLGGATHAMVHPSLMYRSSTARQLRGYDTTYTVAEDIDFYLRCAEVGLLANRPETLLCYRLHDKSQSVVKGEQSVTERKRLLAAAYLRRGLDPVQVPTLSSGQSTTADNYRRWVWWALSSGHVSTARVYAMKALVQEPVNVQSWRAIACSIRGR